jgi:AcrR family transcriptional regulator
MPADKQRIADEFYRHVGQYGYAKTTVEGVAKSLGISKRTVYEHFHGKEEILDHLVRTAAEKTAEDMVREFAACPTVTGRMEQLVRKVCQDNRDWWGRFQDSDFQHQFEFGVQVVRAAYDRAVARFIADGVEAGEYEVPSVAVATRYVGALLYETSLILKEDHDARPDDDAVWAVGKLLAAGGHEGRAS